MHKGVFKLNKKQLLVTTLSGALLGHIFGRYRSSKYTSQFITPYQCEDQVFSILDKTQKPVVIYYYAGINPNLQPVRKQFIKYSYLYHDRATWMLVSIKKNLFHILNNKEDINNNDVALQIRLPKTKYSIVERNGSVQQTQKYFNIYFQSQAQFRSIKHFLQKYAVIQVNDGIQPLREVAQEALFNKVFTK